MGSAPIAPAPMAPAPTFMIYKEIFWKILLFLTFSIHICNSVSCTSLGKGSSWIHPSPEPPEPGAKIAGAIRTDCWGHFMSLCLRKNYDAAPAALVTYSRFLHTVHSILP
jgi:hypothetical protein